MTSTERLTAALGAADPGWALRMAVQELAQQGCSKEELYALLEKRLLDLRGRADHRETDEDALLDTMDALTGWCHTDARLLPE